MHQDWFGRTESNNATAAWPEVVQGEGGEGGGGGGGGGALAEASFAETLATMMAHGAGPPDVVLFNLALAHAEWSTSTRQFRRVVAGFARAWRATFPAGGGGARIRFPVLFYQMPAFGPKQDYLSFNKHRAFLRIMREECEPLGLLVLNAWLPGESRIDATLDGLHYHFWGDGGVSTTVSNMLLNLVCAD